MIKFHAPNLHSPKKPKCGTATKRGTNSQMIATAEEWARLTPADKCVKCLAKEAVK